MSTPTVISSSTLIGAAAQSPDWVPRDDLAVLARTSVDTVKRDTKKHDLPTRIDAAGRVLVNVADFVRIGRLRPEDLSTGATAAESAEVVRARETITALRLQVAELTSQVRHQGTASAALYEQLATKDKQLARQADQLTQLIGRLGAVLAATGGAA